MQPFDWLMDKIRGRISQRWTQVYGGGLAGSFRQDAYKCAEARAAADAVARHGAKFRARHMGRQGDVEGQLAELLAIRPNPIMSAYDLQYKLFMQTVLKNNGFMYAVWDNGKLQGLIPIDYTSCEAVTDQSGALYLDFTLTNGKRLFADYQDVLHLRKYYHQSRVLGDDNAPLTDAVELNNVLNAGIKSAVKNGSTIRGLLKFQKKALAREEITKRRDEFVSDYLDNNASGVAGLDADMEYTQLDTGKLYHVSADQVQFVREGIYRYFGVSDAIVSGRFTEDEWNAFYESVLEPLSIQLSMEATYKLLSKEQRARGERIVYEANRLQYASARTKIELVDKLSRIGMLSVNEGREIFNLPRVKDGDRFVQSLNYKELGGKDAGPAPAEPEGEDKS